jgi:hypothetical protein
MSWTESEKLNEWIERAYQNGKREEQDRIINLLLDLNVVRRCAATNKLVAFDTNGENVIYLTGFETNVREV